jgi:hypothetical protein
VEAVALSLWALIGGILNRFSGWADYLPGRNIYYAALIALTLSWTFYGPEWAIWVFVSVLAYRLPGWYKSLDIGHVSGTFAEDFKVMFLRGLYMAPVFVYAFLVHKVWQAPLLLITASLGATLSYAFGNWQLSKYMKDPFWFIEFAAGAFFGAAVGYTIYLGVN